MPQWKARKCKVNSEVLWITPLPRQQGRKCLWIFQDTAKSQLPDSREQIKATILLHLETFRPNQIQALNLLIKILKAQGFWLSSFHSSHGGSGLYYQCTPLSHPTLSYCWTYLLLRGQGYKYPSSLVQRGQPWRIMRNVCAARPESLPGTFPLLVPSCLLLFLGLCLLGAFLNESASRDPLS